MRYVQWNEEKNEALKEEREVSFEQIIDSMISGGLLETIDNPNQKRYPNQKIAVVQFESYVYLVPFVIDKEKIFFKTIIPSRKATKKYLLKGGKK